MRLIDADAYVEYLHKVLIEAIDEDATTEGIALVKAIVRGFESDLRDENITPTIEPERENGVWMYFGGNHIYQCSKCGATREQRVFLENFCPNCGADMRAMQ